MRHTFYRECIISAEFSEPKMGVDLLFEAFEYLKEGSDQNLNRFLKQAQF
jgi:hypothetical protein